MIFPGASVDPNCIKSKLRWLLETYYREKKKLSLTGAGTLLEDMDASNLYAWFERMHEMMNGRFNADPTALITTPSLDFTSNDEPDMPSNGPADIPMDICGSELYDHSAHGHGLPPILDLIKPTNPLAAVASTSGASSIVSRYSLGTININVMMTPRSGVSVDDDEVDGVGDEIGDVDDNEVDGVGDKVGGVDTSVQCVDLMLEMIPGPQWTTAFGSIYIRTANLLWAPSDVR
ncbi:hypothetical protein NDA17_001535 [Ustilago hordei]|nr:hypothetical protein NDA17_001535 [Ustilago hordei]